MKVYVGTSGWMYDWNLGGSLDWYVKYSRLNAVELNMTFYRYPFRNQIIGWLKRGSRLRWTIKVHRSITHLFKLSDKALNPWFRFKELFKPMDNLIDFYLFQLPPSVKYSERFLERVLKFHRESRLGSRFAIEFRDPSWFENKSALDTLSSAGVTLVSVDSPIGVWVIKSNDTIYLRMHGRYYWYAHYYTDEELMEVASKVIELRPERLYVFFNNDHDMLENARRFYGLMKSLISK